MLDFQFNNMNQNQIVEKLETAYKKLIKEDEHLFRVDANERSLTHKYAEYIQQEFPEWRVDCEYNRNGPDIKKIESLKKSISSDNPDAVSVYPDIIIHQRDTDDNLVVVEAKKSNNTESDDEKLQCYKQDLKYQYAFAVKFLIGDDFKKYETTKLSELIIEK